MGAALKGRNAAVQLLVDRGAKLDQRDRGSRDTDKLGSAAAGHTWEALDYAEGLVRPGVQGVLAYPETAALIRKLLMERGLAGAAGEPQHPVDLRHRALPVMYRWMYTFASSRIVRGRGVGLIEEHPCARPCPDGGAHQPSGAGAGESRRHVASDASQSGRQRDDWRLRGRAAVGRRAGAGAGLVARRFRRRRMGVPAPRVRLLARRSAVADARLDRGG